MTKLTDYKPLSRNPNKGTQRGTGILEQSVRELGAGRSILVDKNGVILAGNHAQEAFVNAGMDDVIEVETDGKQIVVVKRTDLDADSSAGKKMAIMDNRTSEQGLAWDAVVVEDLLNEIKQDEGELDAYLESLAKDTGAMIGDEPPEDAGAQIDKAEELRVKWGVELGQLWQLGKHRMICGDCTDRATVDRVMGGEKADILLNDPPYGMRLDADFSGMKNHLDFANEKGVKNGNKYHDVIGDDVDYDASPVVSMFQEVKEQFWWGADYYSNSLGDTMHTGAWLVWDKRLDESADKMYGSCFELLWSKQKHKRDILRFKWAGIFGTEHEPQRGRMHPNQKPIVLYENLLTRYSNTDEIIVDCYLGSGTTLIACERLGRKCRAVEISPAYCAVAIQRWVDMTGQEPVLLGK